MALEGKALLAFITCLTALGFMLIGYDNGVFGGIINGKPFQETFPSTVTNAGLLGTIVAIYEIGCCVGALATAVYGEILGRRRTICVGAIIMLAGAGFQAGVSSVGAMIAARIVAGLGMGAINSTCPVLMAEVSPKASRGRYVCAQLTLLNLGIFLAYWVGYGFSTVTGSKAWRIPVVLQSIFIIPIIILSFLVPESPRWDMAHGHEDRALLTLARLNAQPQDSAVVMEQFQAIQHAVELERSVGSGSWKSLLSWGDDEIKSKRRLFIACFLQAAQQLGGINGIIYYAGTLLATTGLDGHGSSLVAGFLFTWFFLASFIPWFLIDRVGRRPLLLVCISLMACTFAAQAGLISQVEKTGSKAAGAAAVAVLFLYMGLFTTGFQAVVWVYPSEILPLRMRQIGSSLSTASNWICNFAIVEMTPAAVENIGYKFYIIFAILNALWVPVIYFMFPETKNKSLEEIDLLFSPASVHTMQDAKDHFAHRETYTGGSGSGGKDEEDLVEKA